MLSNLLLRCSRWVALKMHLWKSLTQINIKSNKQLASFTIAYKQKFVHSFSHSALRAGEAPKFQPITNARFSNQSSSDSCLWFFQDSVSMLECWWMVHGMGLVRRATISHYQLPLNHPTNYLDLNTHKTTDYCYAQATASNMITTYFHKRSLCSVINEPSWVSSCPKTLILHWLLRGDFDGNINWRTMGEYKVTFVKFNITLLMSCK